MVTIVYWSGTGNTEAMAKEIEEAVKSAGAEVETLLFEDTSVDAVAGKDVVLLGCPAMGAEELEETIVEPFFTELEGKLSGKKSAFSALTAGAQANGWTTGSSARKMPALPSSVPPLSMKRRITPKNALLSAKRPRKHKRPSISA